MAQATRKGTTHSPMAIHLAQGLKEAALWVFLAIALLLFACLATYSPGDPSPFYSGAGGAVHNAIGPVGPGFQPDCISCSATRHFCFHSCWLGPAG